MTLYKILAIVAVVIAICGAIGLEVAHLKNEGAASERAAEQAAGEAHERQMLQNSQDVDREIAKDPDPNGTLRKEWEQQGGDAK